MTNAILIQSWAGLIGLCLLYAAFCDIAVRLIPNYLSGAVAALAVPLRVLDHDLEQALLVALLVFAILTIVWLMRLLGGGDVKLWTACSLLLPPAWTAQGIFSLRILLIGGVVALTYLVLRMIVRRAESARPPTHAPSPRHPARPLAWFGRVWQAEKWRARRGGSIPYGVAIALSALFTFWPRLPG